MRCDAICLFWMVRINRRRRGVFIAISGNEIWNAFVWKHFYFISCAMYVCTSRLFTRPFSSFICFSVAPLNSNFVSNLQRRVNIVNNSCYHCVCERLRLENKNPPHKWCPRLRFISFPRMRIQRWIHIDSSFIVFYFSNFEWRFRWSLLRSVQVGAARSCRCLNLLHVATLPALVVRWIAWHQMFIFLFFFRFIFITSSALRLRFH